MLMYGGYNAETLEKLINTVHNIHNTTSSHEKLFAGQHSSIIFKSLYVHPLGLHHYSINSLLYLRTIQDKYIALHRKLITQLHIYASAIRILAKGYLPNTLVTPFKLKEILSEVRKTLWVTNPKYDLVIDRLHLYYDMHLVPFGIVLCSPSARLSAFIVPYFFYEFGTWMSRGLVVHLWSCEYWAITVLYSFLGFPSLYTLRQNKETCTEREL